MCSTPSGPASLFTKLQGTSFEHHACMMACKVSHKDVVNKSIPDDFESDLKGFSSNHPTPKIKKAP